MSMLGITPEMVSNVLSQTDFVTSNGYLSNYRFLYLAVTNSMVRSAKELENLVIRNSGKRIVTLRDIAEVKIQEAKEYIRINANGKESILIAVIKQPNANLIDLSDRMKDKITEMKANLPSDVVMEPYYVQADFVRDSVKSVTDSVMFGLLLAITNEQQTEFWIMKMADTVYAVKVPVKKGLKP